VKPGERGERVPRGASHDSLLSADATRDVPSRTAGTLLHRVLTHREVVKRQADAPGGVVPAPVVTAPRGPKVGAERAQPGTGSARRSLRPSTTHHHAPQGALMPARPLRTLAAVVGLAVPLGLLAGTGSPAYAAPV